MVFLSKKERLKIVLDIVNKLKNFKLKNGNTITPTEKINGTRFIYFCIS